MKTLEGLILILLGLCAILYFSSTQRKASGSYSKPTRPENRRSRTSSQKSPAPFDATGAKHLNKPKVIEGRARIVDGDTIVINKTQIRLFGIDAPEIDHPYGQKAKWALIALCKGNIVRTEVTDVDTYGRVVGKCYLPDGRDLSAEMVKMGLAIDWPKFSGGRYQSLETNDVRKKLWLADARQKGQIHVWEQFDYDRYRAKQSDS